MKVIQFMNMRDLDLNLLLVFEAIYTSGNISRAANHLDLSQPALSNALARLRKQMDDPLFVRGGNGVVPTLRAEEIIDPIRDALAMIRQSVDPGAVFDPETSKRHFRMIVADPLEQIIMSKLLNNLGRNSLVTFELQPPQAMQIEDALLLQKTDLAIFLLHNKNAELNSKSLCPVDLVVLARKDHPRIQGAATMAQLKKEGFVTLTLAPRKLANSEKVTFWQRLHLREVCHVYKVSSIGQMVAQTDLIGVVPRVYAEQIASTNGIQFFDLPVEMSNQSFHMIWHKRADMDASSIWLRDQVASCFSYDAA